MPLFSPSSNRRLSPLCLKLTITAEAYSDKCQLSIGFRTLERGHDAEQMASNYLDCQEPNLVFRGAPVNIICAQLA
jgi:hypothetical protein